MYWFIHFISFINWRFNCYHQASDVQDSSVAVWLCSNHAKDVGGESEMIWPEIETQVKTPNAQWVASFQETDGRRAPRSTCLLSVNAAEEQHLTKESMELYLFYYEECLCITIYSGKKRKQLNHAPLNKWSCQNCTTFLFNWCSWVRVCI